jgi:hypothetical protein
MTRFLNLVAQAKTLHCLLQDETAENTGRASFKSTNPRVIFVLGMQNYQVFSMMNVDHALLQKYWISGQEIAGIESADSWI